MCTDLTFAHLLEALELLAFRPAKELLRFLFDGYIQQVRPYTPSLFSADQVCIGSVGLQAGSENTLSKVDFFHIVRKACSFGIQTVDALNAAKVPAGS